jgi:uncharacterized repeat protein (TIGR03806 family)
VLQLPVGCCIIKNFYYPSDFRKPEGDRRILETRLLVHLDKGWEAREYIWNDEQTDAQLAADGDIKHVAWIHYDGSPREVDYVIPTQSQCKNCHLINGSMSPIGPKVRNLNTKISYPSGSKNQLTYLADCGVLNQLPALAICPTMPNYLDTSATLDSRARAYLDINCAHCHSPHGSAYTSGLYLQYDNTDLAHLGFNKPPVAEGKGTGGLAADILPGDPTHSVLTYRMAATDAAIKMPPLGRSIVHQEGLALLTQWIAADKNHNNK